MTLSHPNELKIKWDSVIRRAESSHFQYCGLINYAVSPFHKQLQQLSEVGQQTRSSFMSGI